MARLYGFPYAGGKVGSLNRILPLLPHAPRQHFVDVFGGGGSILLSREPAAIETLNDRNRRLVNFFRVLRSQPDELIGQIEMTPYSRVDFDDAEVVSDDPVEDARRFFVRITQSFAHAPSSLSWAKVIRGSRCKSQTKRWKNYPPRLWAVSQRLKDVQIECGDALEILRRYDTKNTLFYCDPPYHPGGRTSGAAYAQYEMTASDHDDLLSLLDTLKGRVVLSGYNVGPYRDLDWRRTEVSKAQSIGTPPRQPYRTEVVWSNFEMPDDGTIFATGSA